MNNTRRKRLNKISKQLSDLRNQLEDLMAEIEEVKEEEEEYRDNIPENMQAGERYEKADNACSNLDEADNWIQDAISNLESVECNLDAAAE